MTTSVSRQIAELLAKALESADAPAVEELREVVEHMESCMPAQYRALTRTPFGAAIIQTIQNVEGTAR